MNDQPTLVIGATGKTGSRVADRLRKAGRSVRAGSRNGPTPFDWTKDETWGPALHGVGRAYITYFPDIAMPGAVEQVERFSAAAQSAGVQRLVMLSGRGEHHAQRGEAVVRAAGVDFTIIRSAWFAQNFSEGELRAPILSGVLPMPGGDIREPIIDIDDIADVAFAALTEDGHSGETYEVTGPELLTFAEMAATLSVALGRPIAYAPISFDAFRSNVEAVAGPMLADVFTTIAQETLDGRNAHCADGVERALGRRPRSFQAFAAAAAKRGVWREAA
ncbi:MAG: NmrA family NAD(P)-binding protein [Pseudomonadota bacterium]